MSGDSGMSVAIGNFRTGGSVQCASPWLRCDCVVTSAVCSGIPGHRGIQGGLKTQPLGPNWNELNWQPSGSIPVSATNSSNTYGQQGITGYHAQRSSGTSKPLVGSHWSWAEPFVTTVVFRVWLRRRTIRLVCTGSSSSRGQLQAIRTRYAVTEDRHATAGSNALMDGRRTEPPQPTASQFGKAMSAITIK